MEWWQLFLAIIFVMLMLRRWRDRQDSATGGRDASSKRLSKTASYNIRIPEAKMRVKNKKDTWKWSRSEQRKKGKR